MPLTKNDTVRLQHMLDAARKALLFIKGKMRADLEQDEQLTLALARLIEILGEAATRISKELQNRYPSIAWKDIISTRNRLIHAYFDVDLDVLWQVSRDDLTPLIKELEIILDRESGKSQQKLF